MLRLSQLKHATDLAAAYPDLRDQCVPDIERTPTAERCGYCLEPILKGEYYGRAAGFPVHDRCWNDGQ